MPSDRLILGTGQATSLVDGDRVTIEIGARSGKIITANAPGMFVSGLIYTAHGRMEEREFRTGEEARAHGDTFGGCDTARKAARQIHTVFGGLPIDSAMAVTLDDLLRAIGDVDASGRWCVGAVLLALRRALIDIRMRILAEEVVEGKHARVAV